MPRAYEHMRDKFAGEGLDYDKAQAKAAAIYNSKHKENPVTGGSRRHKARKALAKYK
jgi:hypothetical protein